MLLRGGHLGGVAAKHHPLLTGLGLAAIVDLRTSEERAGLPFPGELTGRVEYWTRDYDLSRGDIVAMLRDPATSRDDMWQRMIANYRRFPLEQHEGIGAALRLLVQGRVPLLINCTAGKDRTGVTAAIILSALGVPREIVRADYALTEQLHDPAGQLFDVDPDGPFAYLLEVDREVWSTMMRSAPEFIDAMLDGIDEDHGGIEAYLLAAHGMGAPELAAMRGFLLEG
jgi:protein-tyrosine phosphatase